MSKIRKNYCNMLNFRCLAHSNNIRRNIFWWWYVPKKNFVNTGIRFTTLCFLQIYVQTRYPANQNMYMVKDEYPDRPLTLEGALGKRKHYQQFQPVITLAKGYTIHWDQVAPAEVTIWLINFSKSVNTHTLTHTRAAPATAHTAHTHTTTLPAY